VTPEANSSGAASGGPIILAAALVALVVPNARVCSSTPGTTREIVTICAGPKNRPAALSAKTST
jgi:hypothetical protein